MSFTLSPEGQLRAGLLAILVPALSGVVAPSNIIPSWQDINMALPNGVPANTPIVVIHLEPAKLSREQPSGSAGGTGSLRSATNPTPDGLGNVTTLVEMLRKDQPVRIIVQCNGLTGKTTRDVVANRILGVLGKATTVFIPDSLEAVPASTPWTAPVGLANTVYGLSARLTYVSDGAVDNDDARHEYRHDLVYTATHSVYTTQSDPLTDAVAVTQALQP